MKSSCRVPLYQPLNFEKFPRYQVVANYSRFNTCYHVNFQCDENIEHDKKGATGRTRILPNALYFLAFTREQKERQVKCQILRQMPR